MSISAQPHVEINIEGIMADLEKFGRVYCQTVAKKAIKLIDEFAYNQMIKYYGEYSPRIYDRTNQMRDVSHKPHYQEYGRIYEGGIDIHSSFTNHMPKGISEEEIYEQVWVEGIHGYEKRGYPVSTWYPITGNPYVPYRIDIVKKKAYSSKTLEYLKAEGLKEALKYKNGYTILKFK